MANGNPIAVTPGFELSTENVTVDVYRSESKITGDYTFRRIAQPRSNPENDDYDGSAAGTNGLRGRWRPSRSAVIDYGIRLAVPIILPTNGVTIQKELAQPVQLREKYLTDSMQERIAMVKPIGAIDGQDFSIGPPPFSEPFAPPPVPGLFGRWDEIRQVQSQLPVGWELVFFRGYREGDSSRREVKLHLSYTQPHLPGNVSAYLPILPTDVVKKNYLITFQAQDGVHFAPVASYDVLGQASDTKLSVRPVDVQLLEVQAK